MLKSTKRDFTRSPVFVIMFLYIKNVKDTFAGKWLLCLKILKGYPFPRRIRSIWIRFLLTLWAKRFAMRNLISAGITAILLPLNILWMGMARWRSTARCFILKKAISSFYLWAVSIITILKRKTAGINILFLFTENWQMRW